jgi:hypothetical protein
MPPEAEDGLVAATRERLAALQADLKGYTHVAATPHHPGKAVIDSAIAAIGKQLGVADSYEFIDAFVKAKDDWLDLSDDIHDVISFYKTQTPTWRRLLEALERFEPNREALDKDVKAAVALSNLEGIRDNPNPWGAVSQIEPLITTVDTVNEALAQSKREHALLSIDAKIAEVEKALDAAQASDGLRNRALLKLQELKTKVAGLTSIPMIFYCQAQAGDALDTAMATIESAAARTSSGIAGEPATQTSPSKTGPAAVAPKPAKVIRASDFTPKTYLETETEVDAYVSKLRAELMAALSAGQRIRIQ